MIDTKKLLKGAVMLVIMLGVGFIPAPEPMTQLGMKIFGIFIGMIFGWIFIDIGSVSIIGIILFILTGCADAATTLAGTFGTQMTMMILAILFLVAYAQDQKLGDFVADWMMHRKSISGKPYLFFFMYLVACFLVSFVSNAVAAMYIMLSIFQTINEKAGFKKNSKESSLFILGILISTLLAETSIPAKGTAAMYIGFYSSITGTTFNGLLYSIALIPFCFAVILLYTLICKLIFRPNFNKLNEAIQILSQKQPLHMTTEQKRSIVVILIFMLCLMLPGISLPFSFWGVFQVLGTGGISLMCIGLFYFLTINDKPIFNLATLSKGFAWDILFMVCSISFVTGQLTTPQTGVQELLQITIYPYFEHLGPVMLVALLIIGTVILTNLINNFVAGSLMISFASMLLPAFPSLTLDAMFIILTIASMTSYALPSACPNTAIAFGLKEYVSFKGMIFYGVLVSAMITLFLCVAVWPFVNLIF